MAKCNFFPKKKIIIDNVSYQFEHKLLKDEHSFNKDTGIFAVFNALSLIVFKTIFCIV